MSNERKHGGNEIPLGGLFLLFIGTVLLLQNLDVLPWSLWNTLWRFWPMLLIITGVSVLLRRWNVWLVSLLILALLLGSLSLAIWQSERHPSSSGRGTAGYLIIQ